MSRLFRYVALSPVVFSNVSHLLHALCAEVNQRHVLDKVCVICGLQSALCEGFSLCYLGIQSVLRATCRACYVRALRCVMRSSQQRASSLRSEHASLRSVGRERQGTPHDQFLA